MKKEGRDEGRKEKREKENKPGEEHCCGCCCDYLAAIILLGPWGQTIPLKVMFS